MMRLLLKEHQILFMKYGHLGDVEFEDGKSEEKGMNEILKDVDEDELENDGKDFVWVYVVYSESDFRN